MLLHGPTSAANRRSGSSLVMVSFLVSALSVLSLALVMTSMSSSKERRQARDEIASLYVCEGALADAVFELRNGGSGDVGSQGNPVAFGDSTYWVEATALGGGLFSLQATGLDGRTGTRIDAVLRRVSSNLFTWAAFGDEGMTMDSNAMVDSYDSGAGPYGSQDVNGSGSSSYANEDGNVGSNQNVGLDSNSTVHGDAVCGPTGTVSVLGNADVTGSTSPAPAQVSLPPIAVPPIPPSGAPLDVAGSSTYTLASGDYHFTDLTLGGNGQLDIIGPARILVGSMTLDSNSSLIVDATGGPVEFYVLDDFVMSSNTLITSTTSTPSDININLESDNVIDPALQVDLDFVDFNSNAQLFGTIYAPNARIDINSNFELFGSIVARHVHLDSNSKVHFDEALLNPTANGSASFQRVAWHARPFQP